MSTGTKVPQTCVNFSCYLQHPNRTGDSDMLSEQIANFVEVLRAGAHVGTGFQAIRPDLKSIWSVLKLINISPCRSGDFKVKRQTSADFGFVPGGCGRLHRHCRG